MSERYQRFDDTFWGKLFHFWPIILLILGVASIIYAKIDNHETRLATVEQVTRDIKDNVTEMRGDIKELLRR